MEIKIDGKTPDEILDDWEKSNKHIRDCLDAFAIARGATLEERKKYWEVKDKWLMENLNAL